MAKMRKTYIDEQDRCLHCGSEQYRLAGFIREPVSWDPEEGDVYTVGEFRACAGCGKEREHLD